MSHAFVTVLLHPEAIEKHGEDGALTAALAPYDEAIEVPAYDEPCWCIGREARQLIRETLAAEGLSIKAFRESFDRNPDAEFGDAVEGQRWEQHIKPLTDREAELEAEHADALAVPSPACVYDDGSGCNATGIVSTTYNPRSRWDYWQRLTDAGWRYGDSAQTFDVGSPTYAIVLPGEGWQEKAELGWFGMNLTPELKDWDENFTKAFQAAIEQGCTPVVCDYHI